MEKQLGEFCLGCLSPRSCRNIIGTAALCKYVPVITGVLELKLFFRVQKHLRSSNAHDGRLCQAFVCVCVLFLTVNWERDTGLQRVCARACMRARAASSAKQMFISISECSCETIRLHYQEHTNYIGAPAMGWMCTDPYTFCTKAPRYLLLLLARRS